ncbi:hypothetical protein EDB19DRAFT_1910041 [Suillus lakei]|nr:hypothetical protein EDB19DRAFT_1910041 [Suillus lakei]
MPTGRRTLFWETVDQSSALILGATCITLSVPQRSTIIVPLVLQFGKNIAPHDYGSIIVAPFVKLFAGADRGTRIALLDSLPDFTEKLDKMTVVDKIWPNPQTGFTDTVTVIRGSAAHAVVLLSPKLSNRGAILVAGYIIGGHATYHPTVSKLAKNWVLLLFIQINVDL